MKKSICLCLVCEMICAVSAKADVYSALQSVYDTNPLIAKQRQVVEGAKAGVKLAGADAKPYLGINANIGVARTKLMGETFDYVPKEVGIQAQQNIFKGFSMWAEIKSAKSNLEAQRAVLYATQQDVFIEAINAYINVLNAKEVLKLNKNNQHVLQEYYDYCKDLSRVGTLTKTDVAQASARLENAKYQLSAAQADYDNSLETFKRIYGDIDETWADISLEQVEQFWPENVELAQEYALANHPTILALEAQEKAVKENVVVARKTILPSVDLRASAIQFDDIPYVDRVRDGRVGLYLSMPLYDKGTAFANVDKVRATVAEIQEQKINTQRVITEKLHQAWNLYEAQTVAIKAAQSAVSASKLALNGIREEQKRGRRTVLDVLNAEQELLNSQVALSRVEHGRIAAYFSVLSAIGRLTPENLGINIEQE